MTTRSVNPDLLARTSIASTIPSSELHRVFRDADDHERATGAPVTKLHVGEPYFTPPPEVGRALAHAVERGLTGYTAVEGLPELREALAAKLAAENGVDTDPSRLFVTPGSCQGLAALMQAVAEPGAEILLPELHWPIHLQQAILAGLRPVFYPLDRNYRPDPDTVLAAATPGTRLLLLNSPANPTGAVLDIATQRALLDLARGRGWQIISDEAYEHFVFEGEHVSIASLERDVPVPERIVHSVHTFSKSLAMTGYRLGYLSTADERTAKALRIVQEANLIAMSTPVQYAGLEALRLNHVVRDNHHMVLTNRNTALPAVRDAGLLPELPAGGWYAVLDVAPTGLTAEEFAADLLAVKNVAVVPGTGFALTPRLDARGRVTSAEPAPWSRHLIRIAMCVEPHVLRHGVKELLDFAHERGGAA
ncbi:pyridoxal phosphate-dependent aminotransferase [Lentzea sp. DG1S-22]|uniref:pyridoxal phosphate-dependent aminotransferase n=1 Tax=Lentzea sp. DG1S-22 TaxID=3108822 RepID=UPI002E75ED0B|nr:pyridoxal phosphate-dependent aminotransferase [Lentzea sp. DG1S-22]WVH82770.1 pyridoxal phosphate-dependent aminotransferase [Lentzea sp. DG1S-22]